MEAGRPEPGPAPEADGPDRFHRRDWLRRHHDDRRLRLSDLHGAPRRDDQGPWRRDPAGRPAGRREDRRRGGGLSPRGLGRGGPDRLEGPLGRPGDAAPLVLRPRRPGGAERRLSRVRDRPRDGAARLAPPRRGGRGEVPGGPRGRRGDARDGPFQGDRREGGGAGHRDDDHPRRGVERRGRPRRRRPPLPDQGTGRPAPLHALPRGLQADEGRGKGHVGRPPLEARFGRRRGRGADRRRPEAGGTLRDGAHLARDRGK